jgi:hypothetical protein
MLANKFIGVVKKQFFDQRIGISKASQFFCQFGGISNGFKTLG